jgi:membrane-associated phospholipid phosphatase
VVGAVLLATHTKIELFTYINTRHAAITDTLMYNITWMGQPQIIIPVLVLMLAFERYRNWWYATATFMCQVTPLIILRLLKSYFDAPRPLNFFKNAPWVHHSEKWPIYMHLSFPSGHSEGAFAFFCFLSLLLPPTYRRFGFLFFLLAFSVCYSRVYLAAHFFADVYVGSIIGLVICTVMFSVMENAKPRFFKEKNTFA